MAEFLKADEPIPTQAETMLNRLADKDVGKTKLPEEDESVSEPKLNEAKLDSLSESKSKKPSNVESSTEKKAAKNKNLDEVDDKLSGLLGED